MIEIKIENDKNFLGAVGLFLNPLHGLNARSRELI